MSKRRCTVAVAIVMAAVLGVSGCAGRGGQDSKSSVSSHDPASLVQRNPQDRAHMDKGGTAIFAVKIFPTNYNKLHTNGNNGDWGRVTKATDPTLFIYSPQGVASARTEYLTKMPHVEITGGKQVVTYDLNPKAIWNDGTKIDWTAFEATWKSQRAPVDEGKYNNAGATAGYEDIESIEKGDTPEQVVVTFKQPFNPITEIFDILIHPKVAKDPETFNTLMKTDPHPELRSGPFVIKEIDEQSKTVVIVPNDKWWGNAPMLDRVVFRQMEDSATILAFKNGEIDATDVANKARLEQIRGTAGMELRRSQLLYNNVYIFNAKSPNIKDIAVRKAIWQGLDREQLRKIKFNGVDYTEKPVESGLFFSFDPRAENNTPVKFDPQAAQKTLHDAGYAKQADGFVAKDGKKLSVRYTTFGDDPLSAALAQTTQSQLKAIGIDLQLDIRPSAQFGSTVEKKDFDFIAMAWSATTNSPLGGMCQSMCSDSGNNFSAAGTPELDARIKKLGSITDEEEQAKEMNAVEKEWMAETYGQLPLWNGPKITATREGLANWGPGLFQELTPKWEEVGWQKGFKKG
ncbi:Probable monoacyl phosphatidylinositol tetramannoside-binding protein LpqW precursor [Dermatophilus congolensis]|uniref:Probable monoacyl phosphatidylinositol tetramannoside-binding protein LpqW n=1 Tax=Dermatophilus congolensis TaxID=1863 RepID=A0A239VIE0_9MICO|nr:Probable monoacyl phosphatidylinositol tetramannoside-binding protein LpqW precursor [Dermatophilus congolensis]